MKSICVVSRYTDSTGAANERILQARTSNWLFGHYSNRNAYYSHGAWIMAPVAAVTPNTNWGVFCTTTKMVGGDSSTTLYINGQEEIIDNPGNPNFDSKACKAL